MKNRIPVVTNAQQQYPTEVSALKNKFVLPAQNSWVENTLLIGPTILFFTPTVLSNILSWKTQNKGNF